MSDTHVTSRWESFVTLCLARWRQFYREREVIIWSFVFPLVLSCALGLAFRNRPAEAVPVALTPEAAPLQKALAADPALETRVMGEPEAVRALRTGRVAIVVGRDARGDVVYRYDDTRPDALSARIRVNDTLQRGAGRSDVIPTREEKVRAPGSRYIDFVIPGIIGLNIMGGGLWGVGFHLVDARVKRLLKRLVATPMRRADYLLAQMVLRVGFVFIEVSVLLGFGRLIFGVPLRGSLASVYAVGVVGALTFGGIGLLVASRAMTMEKVTGLMNMVMIPMWIASGTFFSSDRFPSAVQPLVHALPLTALNNALRGVILDGATLASQTGQLAILVAWAVVCFLLGLRLFRWT